MYINRNYQVGKSIPVLTFVYFLTIGYTKKIFYNSMLVIFYTLGNFIGPLIMLDHEKPRYIGAMIGFCAGNGVAIICFFILRAIMIRENKRRLANPPEVEVDAKDDLTDKENKAFIFRL